MIEKRVLVAERVRQIRGSFAFIEHRFLRAGFWSSLSRQELLLYLFLVLASDRQGISFYSYDKICTLLVLTVDEYVMARDSLIGKDLIAFDGTFFQVLSLPDEPIRSSRLLVNKDDMAQGDPATVAQIISHRIGGCHD
jgi:hypothetical protein